MSDFAAGIPPADAPVPAGTPAPSRSFWQIVWREVSVRWTARVGFTWVLAMACCAVFAPFLANSHPLLFKENGQWGSPLLRHLTPADVVLLVMAAAVVGVALLRRVTFRSRLAILLFVLAAALPLALWPTFWRDLIEPLSLGTRPAWSIIRDSRWAYLSMVGLAVAVLPPLVLVPWLVRLPTWGKAVLIGLVTLLAMLLVAFPVRPPLAIVYDDYRVKLSTGVAERAVHVLVPFSPDDRQRDVAGARLRHPSARHWFGSTDNGADLLANMIHGTRIALSIGFISTGIAVTIGILIGGTMGYFGGKVDLLGMRFVEVFASIPTFLLLLTFVANFEPNLYVMMVIIGLTGWVGYATYLRAEFFKLRKQDFVQAAVASGLPLSSVLFRHILPNALTPVVVSASFSVASAILAEASLSFLGLGLPNEASWGKLLNQALGAGGAFHWWLAVYPGMAIFMTVFAYNMIGEALRDALDPRIMKRE